jgi:hypothetical protein
VFVDSLEAQGRALLRLALDPADPDVGPPPALLEHAHTLRAILAVHASTLGDNGGAEQDDDGDPARFAAVLRAAVAPALEAATGAAATKRAVRPAWDAPVFVLNCLACIEVSLP